MQINGYVTGSIALVVYYLIAIHDCSICGAPKNVLSCIIAQIIGYVYKMPGINSAILLHLYVNSVK